MQYKFDGQPIELFGCDYCEATTSNREGWLGGFVPGSDVLKDICPRCQTKKHLDVCSVCMVVTKKADEEHRCPKCQPKP